MTLSGRKTGPGQHGLLVENVVESALRRFAAQFVPPSRSQPPVPGSRYNQLKTNNLTVYTSFTLRPAAAKCSERRHPLLHRFAAPGVTNEYLLLSTACSAVSYASVPPSLRKA